MIVSLLKIVMIVLVVIHLFTLIFKIISSIFIPLSLIVNVFMLFLVITLNPKYLFEFTCHLFDFIIVLY